MRLQSVLLMALVGAVLLLATTSTYSAYVTSRAHRNNCTSRNVIVDAVHDVVAEAFEPFPGQKVNVQQAQLITEREAALFERLDQARC